MLSHLAFKRDKSKFKATRRLILIFFYPFEDYFERLHVTLCKSTISLAKADNKSSREITQSEVLVKYNSEEFIKKLLAVSLELARREQTNKPSNKS